MAELNGKKYEKWYDYIVDKFPSDKFDILEHRNEYSANVMSVTSKEEKVKTKIVFDFPTIELCRVTFYNPDSPLHNADNDKERLRALMYVDYELLTVNLTAMDIYLQIPLYFGWTEKATYYKGKLVRSEFLYNDGKVWHNHRIYQDLSWFDKVGCLLALIAWPILYVQYRFVKHRLNKNNKNVKITTSHILPMIE